MLKSCVGKLNILLIFLFLLLRKIAFVPLYLVDPSSVNARIDCKKNVVTIGLDDMVHEFNFSKFSKQHREEELPSKDEIIGLASITVPLSDPLKHYLLDHENDMFMNERREIDEQLLHIFSNCFKRKKSALAPFPEHYLRSFRVPQHSGGNQRI